ncbi:hypothetical protein [Nonomuraea africana]|uniref:DUF2029 domain-containing protein n=1 Tax=Nonomuraea africana TaxID=46171 RepID=A0ABR9KWT9_9ACTN|nr:hypothetical protein [Nonomuraea africana]MBE1566470.1 hypothetical protein [Nonomuraea africana]
MDYAVLTGIVLVSGVVLALVAQWRDWRPPLWLAIAVGVGVRVLIMYTSAIDTWQPVDFVNSFKPAGEAVLNRQDPVLGSNGGWHFLPTIPYVYGILLWLGIPWEYAGRLVTVVADIVLIPLVGKLAGGPRASLRAFQYALSPLALLVASVHGQVEPVALVFGVAAFVVARGPGDPHRPGVTMTVREMLGLGAGWPGLGAAVRQSGAHLASLVRPAFTFRVEERPAYRRALWAGLLMGLALCAKSWPIWLIPGMLLLLRGFRPRLIGMIATGIPPVFFLVTLPIFAGTSLADIPKVMDVMSDIRPIVGEWGWTAVLVGGDWTLHSAYAKIGTYLIYASVLAVCWVWRRADPVDLTTAILLVFMVVTPRLGAQYLLWFVPFLIARPTRFAWPALLGTALWSSIGYLWMTQHWKIWQAWHPGWAMASVVLLPVLALAMPWDRRVAFVPVEGPRHDHGPSVATATGSRTA